MTIFYLITLLISATAIFAYINTRFIKLPNTIGLILLSIIFSLAIGIIHFYHPEMFSYIFDQIRLLDFSKVLLNILLSFMLFAGALHTDFALLKTEKLSIILFAIVGVLLSTFLVATILYYVVSFFDIGLPYIYCLLFGALISPTDPIAVLGILTKAKVPKHIEINIVGESLFNDGIGVVVFMTLLIIINQGSANFGPVDILLLFAQEAGGGLIFGILLAYITYYLLRSIDEYETELIITIAIVMGGNWLAFFEHAFGPGETAEAVPTGT